MSFPEINKLREDAQKIEESELPDLLKRILRASLKERAYGILLDAALENLKKNYNEHNMHLGFSEELAFFSGYHEAYCHMKKFIATTSHGIMEDAGKSSMKELSVEDTEKILYFLLASIKDMHTETAEKLQEYIDKIVSTTPEKENPQ